jgi:hypothetical protein
MKIKATKIILLLTAILLSTVTVAEITGVAKNSNAFEAKCRWDFNNYGNTDGWSVPASINGTVMGGAMWLTIQREPVVIQPPLAHQIWGTEKFSDLTSPKGLDIPASTVTKVRMRILNLSPETDGLLFWRTKEKPDVDAGAFRFTMKPSLNEWQDVVCDVDKLWQGTIDQIRIIPALLRMRGDIWIDWIAITDGKISPAKPRPDVCSDKVVPQVKLAGISQEDFQDAFKVLDEALWCNVPLHGFNYPVMGPGGAYGENWWQLDSSLNVAGAKWANQNFAENVIRGFIEVQANNPDGRIDLWGGSPVRGQVADMSSLPRYFEVAYDVVCRSGDTKLAEATYESMKKYLGFWLSAVKVDSGTGLVTGSIEESFAHISGEAQTEAPVDLNVAVALGCYKTARLAEYLNKPEDARQYKKNFDDLCKSINTYLWDEEKGAYYNYLVKEKKRIQRLICSTFDTLRLGIAPDDRVEKLIPLLLDPNEFNWGVRPVTSIAKTDKDYVEATGKYDGRAWLGDIWTMRNVPIIAGLEDCGRHDLAAELTWATIKAFNSNYCEYVEPSTGSGEGVQRYGWSASQYIQLIIEYLFGVRYDRAHELLRIVPHLPEELQGKEISISNLIIPTGQDTRLKVTLESSQQSQTNITIEFTGALPKGEIEMLLPKPKSNKLRVMDGAGKSIPVLTEIKDMKNVAGVRIPVQKSIKLSCDSQ